MPLIGNFEVFLFNKYIYFFLKGNFIISRNNLEFSESHVRVPCNLYKVSYASILFSVNLQINILFLGFPIVLGCNDGTFTRFIAPNENEPDYVNRKGFHSLNVQVKFR